MRLPVLLSVLLAGVSAVPALGQRSWVQKVPTQEASSFALAFDPVRRRPLRFGGYTGFFNPDDRFEEWDGEAWVPLSPASRPSRRSRHAMATDDGRNRVVLFGGAGAGRSLADTWEWDGSVWTQRHPAHSPSPRVLAAMAYDAMRGVMVMFGGGDGTTWEWDGTDWAERKFAVSPSKRVAPGLCYDAVRHVVVLHGGKSGTTPLNDTWEYDGSSWTLVSPSGPTMGVLAYDAARQRTVLRTTVAPGATWEWDGTSWTMRASNVAGPLAITYDPGLRRVIQVDIAALRAWDGTSWIKLGVADPLPLLHGVTLTDDEARGELLFFGGFSFDPSGRFDPDGRTLVWDGLHWRNVTPATSPDPRGGQAMAYDAGRQRVVLFGGNGYLVTYNDMWEWDGRFWTEVKPPQVPPGGSNVRMVYDSARQRLVLITGYTKGGQTWEYSQGAWTRIALGSTAPATGVMAYDPGRDQIVLFDGGSFALGTWVFDGTAWSQRSPVTAPTEDGAITYDPSLGGVLFVEDPPGRRSWLWDGTTWNDLGLAGTPELELGAIAYHHARGITVSVEGRFRDSTWALVPDVAATTAGGGGCGGTFGIPWLAELGRPVLGNGRYAIDLGSAAPGRPVALLVGAGSTRIQLGGCSLFVDPSQPLLALPMTATLAGSASWRLPVPLSGPSGADAYAQALVLDPSGPFAGLSTTHQLHVRFGE